jgi:uncharacterized protein YecE (DUF72 family)
VGRAAAERIHVGCATWAIGARNDHLLPHVPGGNLARYAVRLTVAEVNSSFHRRHGDATWGRWARSGGPSFRFSVKLPKTITHERRLVDVDAERWRFYAELRAEQNGGAEVSGDGQLASRLGSGGSSALWAAACRVCLST